MLRRVDMGADKTSVRKLIRGVQKIRKKKAAVI